MSLKEALAGVKQGQNDEQEHAAPTQMQRLKTPRSRSKVPTLQPERKYGKSSNPEFEKVGVYVRTETRRKAQRKWEDQGGGDLSDLIETLLNQYSVS